MYEQHFKVHKKYWPIQYLIMCGSTEFLFSKRFTDNNTKGSLVFSAAYLRIQILFFYLLHTTPHDPQFFLIFPTSHSPLSRILSVIQAKQKKQWWYWWRWLRCNVEFSIHFPLLCFTEQEKYKIHTSEDAACICKLNIFRNPQSLYFANATTTTTTTTSFASTLWRKINEIKISGMTLYIGMCKGNSEKEYV